MLAGEDRRDHPVVVVRREAPHQIDGVLVRGAEVPSGLVERHDELGGGASLPHDAYVGLAIVLSHRHHDVRHDRP
jgi:hypothetical protein